MNINKKLDRVKQWAGEKMGGEVKTNVSDEFKSLEMEMDLRQDGTSEDPAIFANLISARHAEITQVHDHLRQVPLEAQRSRRQGEDSAGWISGPDNDTSRRGLRT